MSGDISYKQKEFQKTPRKKQEGKTYETGIGLNQGSDITLDK